MKNLKKILTGSIVCSVLTLTACSSSIPDADLDRVLDVTADTLYKFENSPSNTKNESALPLLTVELQRNLNVANPKVHPGPIGLNLKEDGSFQGYHDENRNLQQDSGEKDLFTVEIDAEKERLIATDTNYTRDHRFSGTGLLAGFLIGNLLGRQRAAGVNPKSLSNKTATSRSSYQNARSRAGSGSHSKGK